MIKFFFWFLFSAPRVGDSYVYNDNHTDPWNTIIYEVVDHIGNWYRIRAGLYAPRSITRRDLLSFYTKC